MRRRPGIGRLGRLPHLPPRGVPDSLPEGWDRDSVLEYWSSIGGSREECVDDLADEFEEERATEHCSATKDEVLRTERWRNLFRVGSSRGRQ